MSGSGGGRRGPAAPPASSGCGGRDHPHRRAGERGPPGRPRPRRRPPEGPPRRRAGSSPGALPGPSGRAAGRRRPRPGPRGARRSAPASARGRPPRPPPAPPRRRAATAARSAARRVEGAEAERARAGDHRRSRPGAPRRGRWIRSSTVGASCRSPGATGRASAAHSVTTWWRSPAARSGSSREARPGRAGETREQALEVAGQAPGGGAVEQVAVVLEPAPQPVVVLLPHPEREVGVGPALLEEVDRLDRAAAVVAPLDPGHGEVLEPEHRLEERRARQVPLRIERLEQPLEGQLLVLVGGEGGLAHAGEQLAERRAAGEVAAQHEGVDEEADQRLDLPPPAIGHEGADAEVVLAGEPEEQGVEGGEERP